MEAGLELMRTRGASKWLSDERRNGALANDDMEWGRDNWRPRAVAAGFRYWALVLPESVPGQMRARFIVEASRQAPLTVEIFEDPDSAREWLMRQPDA